MTRPVLLFSLPRSGSTLVHSLLSSISGLAVLPGEPWVLLHYAEPISERLQAGTLKRHGGDYEVVGREDVAAGLGLDATTLHLEPARAAARTYYERVAEGAPFVLDKTPRYALVAPDLRRLLPEARCIVLHRDPLAIASSCIMTWGRRGSWNLDRLSDDFAVGIHNLVEVSSETDVLTLYYEDVVNAPLQEVNRVADWLEVERVEALQRLHGVSAGARLGDPGFRSDAVHPPVDGYEGLRTVAARRWVSDVVPTLPPSLAKRYDVESSVAALAESARWMGTRTEAESWARYQAWRVVTRLGLEARVSPYLGPWS